MAPMNHPPLTHEPSVEQETATLPNTDVPCSNAPASALPVIPAANDASSLPIPTLTPRVQARQVSTASITADPNQPRRQYDEDRLLELAADIAQHGIDQPLVVQSDGEGRYRLIAGERRLRAAQLADLAQVPVFVRDDLSSFAAVLLQLRENLQREDLSPVETAQGLERYKALTKKTWETIAKEFGWRLNTLHARRKILKAPEPVLALIQEKKLAPSHYGEIASLAPERQVEVAERIVAEGLTVEETREERGRIQAE